MEQLLLFGQKEETSFHGCGLVYWHGSKSKECQSCPVSNHCCVQRRLKVYKLYREMKKGMKRRLIK